MVSQSRFPSGNCVGELVWSCQHFVCMLSVCQQVSSIVTCKLFLIPASTIRHVTCSKWSIFIPTPYQRVKKHIYLDFVFQVQTFDCTVVFVHKCLCQSFFSDTRHKPTKDRFSLTLSSGMGYLEIFYADANLLGGDVVYIKTKQGHSFGKRK